MKKIQTIVLIIFAALNAHAVTKYVAVKDSLTNLLNTADTPNDSVKILIDIFDLATTEDHSSADSVARIVGRIAHRLGDSSLELEMLRNRANYYTHDKNELEKLLLKAESIENANPALLKETSTFLRMCLNMWYNSNGNESERRNRFDNELERFTLNPPKDIYEQIVLLHSLCLNLSQTSTGTLFKEYTEKLGKLIDKLPPAQYSIRNALNVMAAVNFNNSGLEKESLAADKRLLNVIDSLQVDYAAAKRPFRNYDHYRFMIYTRMLSHFRILTSSEIEDYYDEAVKYRNRSTAAQNDRAYSALLDAYYAMAHKNYSKAHPVLKELLTLPLSRIQKTKTYKLAIECARAVGDNAMLMSALSALNNVLEENMATNVSNKVREMQIIYGIHEMNRNLAQIELDRINNDIKRKDIIIIIGCIVILALLAVIGILYMMYRRTKKQAASLSSSHASLSAESQRLLLTQGKLTRARDEARMANQMKSDFIKNLRHEIGEPLNAITEYTHLIVDCSEAEGKTYLSEYADLVNCNCAFLSAVVNDIFKLSEDNKEEPLIFQRELTNINDLIKLTIDTVKPTAAPGVEISIDPRSEEVSTMVDATRVQQILLNLLRNSIAHTTEGSIIVKCGIVSDKSRVGIAVSYTCCGGGPDI
ncbi:MAG: HAMP domain-containing histidine kinase, partial [Muribaculaceae bacterium]|nr:HAMP domain-containing histidine kinase [Muribaculaceae bacterium]